MTEILPPVSTPGQLRSLHRAMGQRRSDSYVFGRALILVLLIVALDVPNYLDVGSAPRYAILLIPVAGAFAVAWNRSTGIVRRPNFADKVLITLGTLGIVGTTYGVLVHHTATTMRPVFLPMLIAPLYIWTLRLPSRMEVERLLRQVAGVALIYACLNAVVNSGLVKQLLVYKHFRNANELYVAMAIVGAGVLGRWLRLAILVMLAALIFKTYPSLTSFLVVIGTLITLFMTRPRASSARPYVVASLAVTAVLVALLNFTRIVQLSSSYYETVGKTNNNSTRITLWKPAIAQFEASPIYGSWFGGEATAPVHVGPYIVVRLPFHNDYLLFLADGGVLGLGMLLVWLIATETIALRRYRGYIDAGQWHHAMLMRVLLVGFNAFWISAGFNPNLESTGTSATIFAIYGLMMVLGPPAAAHMATDEP